ncbi:MAG: hypothetical protein ACRCXL_06135 [Dermatophilaceae bacterium]
MAYSQHITVMVLKSRRYNFSAWGPSCRTSATREVVDLESRQAGATFDAAEVLLGGRLPEHQGLVTT